MKNESTRKVINVDKPNYVPLFEFKELDNAVIRLSLFKASVEFDITGQTVKLGAKTSKGLKEQSEGFTINKNNLDIDLKNSILVPGTVEIDLELKDASGTMTTASFFITVKSKVLNDKAVEGTNEFDTFTKTAAKIEEDYKGLRRIIIDENQAANLQDQVNQTNAQLDKMKSFITPIMFGAKGNDNEDDTMAIQNALNYCNENKVKLTIPKGIYIISDTLIANNVIIEGYSTSETILKMTSNKPLINMNGGSLENVRISNTGDYNNINLKGIVLGNKNLGIINTKVNLKNIYIETPFYDGIYSEVECDNTSISGINCFVNNKRSVIYIETGSSYPASACVKISDCHIYCRSQYGIYFRRGDNGSIYNNVINNCDECICVVEHRNIEMLNNHIEHRYLQSAIRFEENKNVSVGDIIIPTEKNANGQVFEVITGGVITGTEKFDKFLVDGYGSTISYGNVVLKHISNAIGIRVNNVMTCNISGSFDSSIIGILIGRSNVTSLNINNVSYLGQCDKIIKNCVTGESCNLYINNSSLNGCFDFGDNANHSYKIENTVIINNSINKIGLSNKEKYIFNKEESNINIKTVSADYTIDFENDKIIYVDTSNSNGRVIITFPKTTSTYGKEVTIIKATSDNAYVRINPQDCIGNRDLLKQFDSITVKKLPAVKYMCVTGSYFNS